MRIKYVLASFLSVMHLSVFFNGKRLEWFKHPDGSSVLPVRFSL